MEKIKIEPLDDYVFIVHDKEGSEKEGITFSDLTKTKSEQGVVEAVSSESVLKRGDRVLFNPFQGRTLRVDNKEYVVLRSNQIYAKIK